MDMVLNLVFYNMGLMINVAFYAKCILYRANANAMVQGPCAHLGLKERP
jgi:hypothetical protein